MSEQEVKKETQICPKCGADLNAGPIQVSEEDCREYFRRLIAGEPFEKEYKYLGGEVAIRLRELTTEQTDKLVNYVRTIQDDQLVMLYAFRAKFIASCVYLCVGSNVIIDGPITEKDMDKDLSGVYAKKVGELSSTVANLTDDALRSFNQLIEGAVQEAVTSKAF